MNWTKELPTKAGLYKFRKRGKEQIVQVKIFGDMGAMMPNQLRTAGKPGGHTWENLDCCLPNRYSNGEWYGPMSDINNVAFAA
jgi:hypothetical protein